MTRLAYLLASACLLFALAFFTLGPEPQGTFALQNATATPAEEPAATPEPIEEPTVEPTTEADAEETEPEASDGTSTLPASSAGEAPTLDLGDLNIEIPYIVQWMNSPHADVSAEAFIHWNEDDPMEVPASCARCHSTPGYQDYVGADGTEAGVVDSGHPVGTVVECAACHNDAASHLETVTFPSGVELTDLDESARCMVCHQGRASGLDVMAAVEEAGLAEQPDTVSEELRFINIHYYAAAASLYGSDVHGGFEYVDHLYEPKFDHVEGFNSCADCHNPHTLEVKVEECSGCHEGVAGVEELHDVRMFGSLHDYDGDGDAEEGIYYEIETLREMLTEAIGTYSAEVAGAPIVYDSGAYPYWFVDTNENGAADADEANRDNSYASWTPRLLQAAYNYQTSLKDPGAFAHNAKYHIQLLYDSIESLNEALAEPVDLSTAQRDDAGHFDATAEAFRHFYAEDEAVTSANCTKCHNGDGLPFLAEHGTTIEMHATTSLKCTTCHTSLQDFSLLEFEEVTFPSGATISFDDPASNLCLNCHQGRESAFSIDAAIIRAAVAADEVSEELRFTNPHYFAAGATLFGAEASGAYQFADHEYAGRFDHIGRYDTCTECHNVHSQAVQVQECADCHEFEELTDIREPDGDAVDWDGDGDTSEGIAGEIATMHEQLLTEIYAYASDTIGTPVVYGATSYPYWFTDTNDNGEADADEANRDNQYSNWTPTLLQAAYNYQYVSKDPGAFAHNGPYILQILYDSLEAVGGEDATAGMSRP